MRPTRSLSPLVHEVSAVQATTVHFFAIFQFDGLADTNAPMATPLKSQVNGQSQKILLRILIEKDHFCGGPHFSTVIIRLTIVVSREIVERRIPNDPVWCCGAGLQSTNGISSTRQQQEGHPLIHYPSIHHHHGAAVVAAATRRRRTTTTRTARLCVAAPMGPGGLNWFHVPAKPHFVLRHGRTSARCRCCGRRPRPQPHHHKGGSSGRSETAGRSADAAGRR
jgi:hypothetical protein